MKKRRKRKIKKRLRFKPPFYILLSLIIAFLIINKLEIFSIFNIKYIESIEFNNNEFKIHLRENTDYSCILTSSNKTPDINDKNWVKSENNICTIKYTNNYNNLYIKNDKKILYNNEHLEYLNVLSDTFYPTYKKSQELPIIYIGNKKEISIEVNNEYLELNNLKVKPIKSGKSTIEIEGLEVNETIKSITSKYYVPTTSLTGKENISCDKVSETENDLLDEILKGKVNEVGNKTRAGVIEAARFLTLHFPYKIEYFYENGRLGTNKIDGEGRYYHEGLYLNSSRYSSISKSGSGPKAWGCKLYSSPVKEKTNNGLDCSGFVSWTLLNGGFNPGDLGAGFTSTRNLTDLGELKKTTKSLIESSKIKAGDLVHNYEATGHIGIIIGIDDDNYYVAQAIWYDDNGVTVTKISKSYMPTKFPHVVLMDSYYKEDGKYTEMW